MITTAAVQRFLSQPRITVVGASDAKGNFGGVLYKELKEHGHAVVAVNPHARLVDGDECYAELAAVPGPLGGALVTVKGDAAVQVVKDCVKLGVHHVWLFKGIGGAGALSEEAVAICDAAGVDVVAGACPLMFLEPVGFGHRIHRSLRHRTGALAS